MNLFEFRGGSGPLLVSMPHVGTHVPPEIAAEMTDEALALPDTDWHVDALYDFLGEAGASCLAATHSRYVIDLNRPPDDENLYPGQDTPGLVPIDTFDQQPIYRPGSEPGGDELQARLQAYWQPYHDKLASTLGALREVHGMALLFEAHSIRSEVPRLWSGQLPDLNLGTGDGTSCAPGISLTMLEVARSAEGFTSVLNGRFKGGYITRHYGDPERGVHAIQLELSQKTYMVEDGDPVLRDDLAAGIRPVLRRMLEAFSDYRPDENR